MSCWAWLSLQPDDKPVPAKTEKPPDPTASALLAAHNLEREKEGREPLKLSEKLSQAALAHAKDMAKQQKLDHTGSDKSTFIERVKRQNYPYMIVGENIANGQHDVERSDENLDGKPRTSRQHHGRVHRDGSGQGRGRSSA